MAEKNSLAAAREKVAQRRMELKKRAEAIRIESEGKYTEAEAYERAESEYLLKVKEQDLDKAYGGQTHEGPMPKEFATEFASIENEIHDLKKKLNDEPEREM